MICGLLLRLLGRTCPRCGAQTRSYVIPPSGSVVAAPIRGRVCDGCGWRGR